MHTYSSIYINTQALEDITVACTLGESTTAILIIIEGRETGFNGFNTSLLLENL
jgi:hypothetical protein